MIVAGGSCTGCSANAVDTNRLPADDFASIYVLYSESKQSILASGLQSRRNVHYVEDIGGKAQRRLNALWAGRWYVFQEGLLVRLQTGKGDVSWSLK